MDLIKQVTKLCFALLRANLSLFTLKVALLKFIVSVLDFQIRISVHTHSEILLSVIPVVEGTT